MSKISLGRAALVLEAPGEPFPGLFWLLETTRTPIFEADEVASSLSSLILHLSFDFLSLTFCLLLTRTLLITLSKPR